jgi:hypothetical protein
MKKLILAKPIPVASHIGRAFIPVIFHPDHGPERYPRKAKANPDEAIAYATRVIWWRQKRAAGKRRKLEALSNPRFATWGELAAAPEVQHQAYWAALLDYWRQNNEAELDADVAFDHSRERLETWEAAR